MKSANRADTARGFLAGVIGGVVGGWVKLKCEDLFPPRGEGRDAPPAVMIKKAIAAGGGETPPESALTQGTLAIHWLMSGVFGGLYGAVSETLPMVRSGVGIGYGLSVWIGAHEIAIPVSGFSPPARELSQTEHLSEAFSHSGYGLALELTRAALRATILRTP